MKFAEPYPDAPRRTADGARDVRRGPSSWRRRIGRENMKFMFWLAAYSREPIDHVFRA